jgi:hypothetical protein
LPQEIRIGKKPGAAESKRRQRLLSGQGWPLPYEEMMTPEPLNIIRLIKDGHEYRWVFTDANRDETLRQIALFAAHEELNLNWYDAAKLNQKIRQQPQTQR